MGIRERYQRAADRYIEGMESRPVPLATVRAPLTTNQHILHLLLTLCTFGLWGIIWILRAIEGNRVPAGD